MFLRRCKRFLKRIFRTVATHGIFLYTQSAPGGSPTPAPIDDRAMTRSAKSSSATFVRLRLLRPVACLAFISWLLPATGYADKLGDAHRLLRITEVARDFEQATRHQTRNVIRTYSSIVATTTDQELPDTIKQEISSCYLETYAWEKFESGIANIFADNLSALELKLMLDFFSDKSVPPPMIGQFKALIARADEIEELAIDFMLNQTQGCEEQNVRLILNFLSNQGS